MERHCGQKMDDDSIIAIGGIRMNNKGKARTYLLVIMGALILLSAVFFSTKLRGADRSEEQEKEYRLAKKSLSAADQSEELDAESLKPRTCMKSLCRNMRNTTGSVWRI